LRVLSANKTSPIVKEPYCTFKEFQDRFISKNPASETTPDTAIGLVFRGQAAEWRLNSSLFRLWSRLGMLNNGETSRSFILRIQKLAQKHLNPNWQNLLPDNGYLMAVLQHYARTSFLLDWTLNVDYALYFAFADAPAVKAENVAIYIADIGKVNNLTLHWVNNAGMDYNFDTMLDITLGVVENTGGWAFFRPHQFGDIRFATQEGVFAYQDAADLERYIPEYIQGKNIDTRATRGTLWKVTLPVSERPAVMDYLAKNNISHDTLFARWDEIGRDIVSKYVDAIIKDRQGGIKVSPRNRT